MKTTISATSEEADRAYYSHPYNISRTPENRREPKPGKLAVFVTVREIKRDKERDDHDPDAG